MKQYNKCKIPDCGGNIIPNRSKHNLCMKHEEMYIFLIWAFDNIKVSGGKEQITKSGLILPK